MNFYDFICDCSRRTIIFSKINEVDENGFEDIVENAASSIIALNNISDFISTVSAADSDKFFQYISDLEIHLNRLKDKDPSTQNLKQVINELTTILMLPNYLFLFQIHLLFALQLSHHPHPLLKNHQQQLVV